MIVLFDIQIYYKDRLSNKIRYIYFEFWQGVSSSVEIINTITDERDVETVSLGSADRHVDINYEPGNDYVNVWDDMMFFMDKILFLRLLEEYVDMVSNEENGEVIVTTKRDVIKHLD